MTAPRFKIGWHITQRKLGYNDGREVYQNKTLKYKDRWNAYKRPQICCAGMHAEPTLKHCFSQWYDRGTFICKVRVSGQLTNCNNFGNPQWDTNRNFKFCGERRTVLQMVHKKEFYTAREELFPGKRRNRLNEKQHHQVFDRAVELRDMMGLTYHLEK
jgi:hypothetical protein